MHHVAIMKKSLGFIDRILSGEKTIESRWYKTRISPWNQIAKGDMVFFKNSGGKVSVSASVSKVLQFSDLTPEKINWILEKFGKEIGLRETEYSSFYEKVLNKRYCILIFLDNPYKIVPFDIDKTGFGAMTAWLQTPDITNLIKKT